MKRTIPVLACCVGLAVVAAAQVPVEPPAPMKSAVPEPTESLTKHLRIEVVMEHGRVISGVARDGRLVERRVKEGFDPLTDDQRTRFDAGIRVWFYDGLPGYLFVRYRHVEQVRVVRRVTASEIRKLDARKESWQQAEGVLLPIQRAADPDPDVLPPPSFTGQPDPGMENLDEEQRELLERFPPPAGWTPERYRDLQRDVVLAGREMTVSEDQWTRVYPEWLAAYRIFTGAVVPQEESTTRSDAAVTVAPPAPPAVPAKKLTDEPTKNEVESLGTGALRAPGDEPAEKSAPPKKPTGLRRGGR